MAVEKLYSIRLHSVLFDHTLFYSSKNYFSYTCTAAVEKFHSILFYSVHVSSASFCFVLSFLSYPILLIFSALFSYALFLFYSIPRDKLYMYNPKERGAHHSFSDPVLLLNKQEDHSESACTIHTVPCSSQ